MKRFTKVRATRLSPVLNARLRQYAMSNELSEAMIIRLALRQFLAREGIVDGPEEKPGGDAADVEVQTQNNYGDHSV